MNSSKMNNDFENFVWNIITFVVGMVFLVVVTLAVRSFWTVAMAAFACYAIPVFLYERAAKTVMKWTS